MTASPTGGGVRVLRATTLAVVTLALAATAHVLAGGDLPGVLALALAAGPLALGTVLLTRRRLSLAAVFAWLVPAEITLHVYFGAAAPHPLVPALAGGHVHGGSDAGMPVAGLPGLDPLAQSIGTTPLGHSSLAMLGAHALATVITGLALSHGERVLWLLWESLRPALALDPVPPVPRPAPVPLAPVTRRCPSVFLCSPHPRGPPTRRPAVA